MTISPLLSLQTCHLFTSSCTGIRVHADWRRNFGSLAYQEPLRLCGCWFIALLCYFPWISDILRYLPYWINPGLSATSLSLTLSWCRAIWLWEPGSAGTNGVRHVRWLPIGSWIGLELFRDGLTAGLLYARTFWWASAWCWDQRIFSTRTVQFLIFPHAPLRGAYSSACSEYCAAVIQCSQCYVSASRRWFSCYFIHLCTLPSITTAYHHQSSWLRSSSTLETGSFFC